MLQEKKKAILIFFLGFLFLFTIFIEIKKTISFSYIYYYIKLNYIENK